MTYAAGQAAQKRLRQSTSRSSRYAAEQAAQKGRGHDEQSDAAAADGPAAPAVVSLIPEVVARWEVKYRRKWRAMLRSGRPAELAAFREEYGQARIAPELIPRAYHVAVHRAAELHEPEKEASRAWLREHGKPEEDLAWCTGWPPV